ncbi:MAG TPA: fumarylacetoacetate hydrolase family protein [Mycobacteriales bacterium]|jgi:2-keto-4-pentenoate hydratase/2-oxohepta-3-ene-1,7-dioic acid hydratase in catechol pathway|nr:fumarylacetoacetate hydrolase family protein [Mycobacteriales bacterium]
MKFVGYREGGRRKVGVLVAEGSQVVPLAAALPGALADDAGLTELIEQWDVLGGKLDVGAAAVDLGGLALTAPIPVPRRNIFCVGRNYREHAEEFGRSGYDSTGGTSHQPDAPVVFTKAPSTVVGPGADIDPHPEVTSELDYEAELGVIIGRGGRGISVEAAADHVWGYTIVNDVTARDLQKTHKQWFLGKSLDTFCPMGPYAVTADEVGDGPLEVVCTVNGEVRQRASTADLIFDIPTIIATISAGITLQPGDVIATGTPAGVGIGFTPPRFLRGGDVVEITITGLGTLTNRVA